ncbi:MAG TPA: hypothetical protein PKD90_13640, partial [Phnomibacter sp.]|nr:hypothetical protein [Phnomibacter sp.]
MSGKPIAYKLSDNQLEATLIVDFSEASQRQGSIPAGKGSYTIKLQRFGDKWHGMYQGKYNGNPVSGKLYAFYFPNLSMN